MTVGQFPDSENVICDLAEQVLGWGKAFNELPEDISTLLPCAWCFKVGGSTDGITDRPILQVNIIAKTRTEALALSNQIRELVLDIRGRKVGGVLVDTAEEQNGIRLAAAPMPKQPMVQSTYMLHFRRQ